MVMRRLGMRHDLADKLDHPHVPEGHLRRHVLYRLTAFAVGGVLERHRRTPKGGVARCCFSTEAGTGEYRDSGR